MHRPAGRGGSRIHRGLVGERSLVGRPYLEDPELRRQYATEIAPRTTAALGKILDELRARGLPPPRRALDLGAGTGAAGATLREAFGAALEVVAVDRVAAAPGVVVSDLEDGPPPVRGPFDLIVAAHLLNELRLGRPERTQAEERARLVGGWAGLLHAEGTLIVIEPALRETSRALLAVRDLVLAAGGLRVVAPCLWAGACPALERERDWCHDAAPVPSRPRVDFSYLVLRASPTMTGGAVAVTATATATGASAVTDSRFRVVSDPLVEKGRLRLYGCGAAGRHPLVRLDRHASTANAAFASLRRGDVARVAGTERAGDGLRITAEATVDYVPAEKSSL